MAKFLRMKGYIHPSALVKEGKDEIEYGTQDILVNLDKIVSIHPIRHAKKYVKKVHTWYGDNELECSVLFTCGDDTDIVVAYPLTAVEAMIKECLDKK